MGPSRFKKYALWIKEDLSLKFSASKDSLSYVVQVVQRAVSTKNPLPVLSGILLKVNEGNLTLTATDLELGIECTVPVTVEEEGGVVLPARYLGDIVRRLPDVKIRVEVNKENNNTCIRYGQSEFNLLGISAGDFPMLPTVDGETTISIKQDLLKNMIRQVGFSVSSDDNRPIFTGVLMEIEKGTIKLVATDTHRLAYRLGNIGEKETDLVKSVIIPGKTLNELNRIMSGEDDDLKIAFGDNQVVFEMPGIRFISRLIEGQFPNYKQVIPQGCKSKIKIKTRDLLESTERASLLAKEGSNVVRFSVEKNNMIISSNSPEIGKIEEQIPVETEGEETQIAFNSRYIIDVLKVIDAEEILLELTGSLSPGIIKPADNENYIYLILPIRIV
ncbi:MAG: DNA polymerase III subunit beta [Firmicutes bacterium HGW-Firmicutes-14]|jgi:DNA polymerase-3 subunit beta|nr:MAG: DNA polymerase III subunit beta [Firmicutes bacterium HGW-Firmicutes-14]